MARNVISLIITGQDLSKDQLKQVEQNLDKVGKRLQDVAKISMTAGAAIAGGLAWAVKGFADMEAGIKNALTLVDAQGKEFAEMERYMTELAKKLSLELGQSAQEISAGFYQVLSAGAVAGTEGFEELTKVALKMARTVGLETAQSVEMLSDTVGAFGFELSQAERVADVFFNTSKLVATTVPQITEAMRTAGSTAASVNIDLETTTTTLAALAQQGVKASEAGVGFRQIVLKLANPTEEAAKLMDQLGISMYDADQNMRDLLDVFEDIRIATADMTDEQRALTLETLTDARAFSKFGIILNTTDEQMRTWRDTLEESGSLQKAFDVLMSSLSARFAVLKENIKAARIEIGAALAPAVSDLLVGVTDWVAITTALIRENQWLVHGLAGLSAVLLGGGGLVMGIGTTIRLVGFLTGSFAAILPILGPVTIALGAVIAAFGLMSENAKQANREFHRTERYLQSIKKNSEIEVEIKVKTAKEQMEEDLGISDTTEYTAEEIGRIVVNKMLEGWESEAADKMDAHVEQFYADVKEKIEAMPIPDFELPINHEGYLTLLEAIKNAITEGLEDDPIEVPPLKIFGEGEAEDMVNRMKWASQSIERALSSGLMGMLRSTNKFRDSVVATFKSLAASIIQEISRVVAKWLAAKAMMGIFSLPFGGGGALPSILAAPFAMAQTGGVVMSGSRGVDNNLLAVGKDEAILDHGLTDALRAFLDSGGGGMTIIHQPMLSTASNYEANRMSDVVNTKVARHKERVVVEGEL